MNRRPILSEALGKPLQGVLSGARLNSRRLLRTVRDMDKIRTRIQLEHSIDVPEMCFFSVTWDCNLTCKGCYANGLDTGDNLTIEEIERILRQTTGAGTVLYAIAGGEPLSVPGLLDVLARIKQGIFMVFTNGTLVDGNAVRIIASAGNILPVLSIEGDGEETDSRRGDGTAEAVERAMALLRDSNLPFAYSTMLTRRNFMHVTSRAFQQQMWDFGARLGFLVDYVPVPETLEPELALTRADVDLKRVILKQGAAEGEPFIVNFPEDEYKSGGCMSAGAGFLHIGANGDVEPCTFSHYSTHNLRTSTYLQALQSGFFRSIRDRFSERENPAGGCMLFRHEAEVAELAERFDAKRAAHHAQVVATE